MTPAGCSRRWEVEAARDGRLADAARAAHDEHVARCADCEQERRALSSLGDSLREHSPLPDEVSLWRSRRIVLQRADAALYQPRARKRWLVLSALALVVAGGGLALAIMPQGLRPLLSPRALRVTPHAGTQWRRASEAAGERIELSEGTLELVVRRGPHDRSVVVRVPEGEIEDLGTAFQVVVRAGHTEQITVREGSIVFHRPGQADTRVLAGQSWHPTRSELAPQASPSPSPAPAAAVSALEVERTAPELSQQRPNAAQTPRPHRVAARHVDSSYREDVSYLRILSLLRDGRIEEARAAAKAYRRAFPSGFRVDEVEQILWRTGDER